MAQPSVDFDVIRACAEFSAILSRYNIKYTSGRDQVLVLCPFHDDRNPSLSVSLSRGLFHCFACEASGDVFDFVAKMESVSLVDAGRIVACVCNMSTGDNNTVPDWPQRAIRGAAEHRRRMSVTAPLKLDPRHPYLQARGLTPELAKTFGVGYCSDEASFFHGRVCIPIFSPERDDCLLAYAGRLPTDDAPAGVPKYLLPRGFRKSRVLYNLSRVAGSKHVVLVEGYFSVMRLYGPPFCVPAVALMGRSLSGAQEELLIRSGARFLTLLLDGDAAGRDATEKLLPRLYPQFFVHLPPLPDGEAPDTVAEDILLDAVHV